ncbi:hypothetical protein TNCV_4291661 [Trichonephila clavipes]|nr:hypothetical protein TNCV_4291661 [Trichonephila clavipes]
MLMVRGRVFVPHLSFHRADWDKFTRLAIITGTMVQNRAVDEAVFNVTEAIRNAADAAIPQTSIPLESCANHGGTLPANKPKGNKGGRRVFSGGTPHLIIS